MFLAVPLTAALIIALDASPHTRPLAVLMGPPIEEPADASVAPASAPPGDPATGDTA
jgi:hypothetical protein